MLHAAVIALSSLLLFLVQPLIARLILPWFGGSAAVWTTCMLFFQVMLLAGYGYAHFLTRRLAATSLERVVHTVLLLIALALLPIAPGEAWKPMGEEEPISRILLLLLATVGLPYFLLAATSPLLQAWFVRSRAGEDPYRLFAVSNLASLLALVGYPFLVEPYLTAREQVTLWSWLFAAFAVLCAALAWRTPRGASDAQATHRSPPPSRGDYALWLGLAAAGSALLLAVTNHLTQNVASVPLLWLAPLTLYLLTFIVAFEGREWYRPKLLWAPILGALGVMAWMAVDQDHRFDLAIQLAIFLPGLFIACFFCHGELYRTRPQARHLTAFYLTVSAGGALGGLLVAVVAPLAFGWLVGRLVDEARARAADDRVVGRADGPVPDRGHRLPAGALGDAPGLAARAPDRARRRRAARRARAAARRFRRRGDRAAGDRPLQCRPPPGSQRHSRRGRRECTDRSGRELLHLDQQRDESVHALRRLLTGADREPLRQHRAARDGGGPLRMFRYADRSPGADTPPEGLRHRSRQSGRPRRVECKNAG